MSALHAHNTQTTTRFAELLRFAATGLSATLLYVVLALGFDYLMPQWPGFVSAFIAYALCGFYTYIAHKFFTFRSDGDHKQEAPRFLLLTAFGYCFATGLTAVMHDVFGWPMLMPVVATALIIPVVNYFAMKALVFRSTEPRQVL